MVDLAAVKFSVCREQHRIKCPKKGKAGVAWDRGLAHWPGLAELAGCDVRAQSPAHLRSCLGSSCWQSRAGKGGDSCWQAGTCSRRSKRHHLGTQAEKPGPHSHTGTAGASQATLTRFWGSHSCQWPWMFLVGQSCFPMFPSLPTC